MSTRLLPPTIRCPDSGELLPALARQHGWVNAISSINAGRLSGRELHRAFGDDTAAAWSVLLPVSARNRLLLARPRSVSEVLAAARWFNSTTVLTDSIVERDFLAICAEQSGMRLLAAFESVGAMSAEPPFDVVAIDSASLGEFDSPTCRRLLGPGGILYVAHDRQWDRGPRWLVRNPLQIAKSRRQLRRLGLSRQRLFAVLPQHESPEQIFPLAAAYRRPGHLRMSRRSVVDHLKATLQAVPRLCPSTGIVASAGPADPSWVESLTDHLSDRLSLPKQKGRFPDILVSHAEAGGLLVFLGRDAVARVPFCEVGQSRITNNHRALTEIRALRAAGLSCRTPEPLYLGAFDGVLVGVESRISGVTADRSRTSSIAEIEQRMFRLLVEIQAKRPGHDNDAAHWQQHAIRPFTRSHAWASTASQHAMIQDLIGYLEAVGPTRLPLRRSHGDFKLDNILVSRSDPTIGVIDWDLYREDHFATIDFCHFTMHRRSRMQRRPRLLAMVDWVADRSVDDAEARWTKEFENTLNIDGDWKVSAALTYWAREFSSRIGTTFDLRTDWIQRDFLDLLPEMCRLAVRHH